MPHLGSPIQNWEWLLRNFRSYINESIHQHKKSEEKAEGLFLGFDSSFKPAEHQEEEVHRL